MRAKCDPRLTNKDHYDSPDRKFPSSAEEGKSARQENLRSILDRADGVVLVWQIDF